MSKTRIPARGVAHQTSAELSRVPEGYATMARVLAQDIEVEVNRYNAGPTRARELRIREMRRELARVRQGSL